MSKSIPEFKNEDEERQFWAENDTSDYLDWQQAKRISFSKLRPSIPRIDRLNSEQESDPEAA